MSAKKSDRKKKRAGVERTESRERGEAGPDASQASSLGALEDEFRIIGELGRGGSAVVYVAWESALEREIALKVIRPGLAEDEEAAARLEREARTLARMRHPKIVSLFGTRRLGDGRVALLMQHVAGRTLRDELSELGALPFGRVEQVLRDVAEALAHAHRRRIVHRDVKPENIYMEEESGLALLSDFGIARSWEAEFGLTVAGATLGTPAYMAPEQVDGGAIDGRTDLYSLGMVGYEMLAGRHPWAGESIFSLIVKQKQVEPPPLTTLRPDVPEHLARVVAGLLRKDPAERWQTAESVLDALDRGRPSAAADWTRPRRHDGPVWPTPEDPRAPLAPVGPSIEETLASLRAMAAEAALSDELDAPEYPDPVDDEEPPPADQELPTTEAPAGRLTRRRVGALVVGAAVLLAAASAARLAVGEMGRTERGGAAAEADETGVSITLVPPAGLPEAAVEPPAPPLSEPSLLRAASGDAQEGSVGEALPQPLEVLVLDGASEPMPDVEVEFRILEGSGEIRPAVVRTDADGRAEAVWVLGSEPETSSAVASVAGRQELAALFTARALPRTPARAALEGTGQRGAPGAPLAEPVIVRVVDARDRGLAGIAVRFEATGDGRVEPERAVTDEQGRARAQWRLGSGTGEHRLRVHVPDLPESPLLLSATATPPPLTVRAGLALGGTHSCALSPNGDAVCWGGNPEGQLGAGGGNDGGPAAARVRTGSPLALLAPGVSHTCGLTPNGVGLCWGANDSGQLGDGSSTVRRAPVAVRTDARFVAMATGVSHTCALDASGEVLCWGDNRRGQLGDRTPTARATPAPVPETRGFRSLVAGWFHTCGIDHAGMTVCWGANDSGQLGSGAAGGPSAVRVSGGHRFSVLVAGSSHTCGLTGDGSVYCWGGNNHGQIGDGTATTRAEPVQVGTPRSFAALAAGAAHTCALDRDGNAYCWGRNTFGQLGDGSSRDARRPTAVEGGLRFRSLHASGAHTCGVALEGTRYCWGYNLEGQLGDGTRVHRNRPVPVVVP